VCSAGTVEATMCDGRLNQALVVADNTVFSTGTVHSTRRLTAGMQSMHGDVLSDHDGNTRLNGQDASSSLSVCATAIH